MVENLTRNIFQYLLKVFSHCSSKPPNPRQCTQPNLERNFIFKQSVKTIGVRLNQNSIKMKCDKRDTVFKGSGWG